MPRDLEAELNEAGQWPAAWIPKQPGDQIVGTILRYATGPGRFGPVRTVILQTDSGERRSLWLGSMVLLSLFQAERPRPGERIGVRFLGQPEGKAYKKFALVVDRPDAAPDFSPLGGEQDAEPVPVSTAPHAAPRAAPRPTPYATTVMRPPGARSAAPSYRDAPPVHDDDEDPFNF